MKKFIQIKHVVFSHYEKLRWYFIDTKTKRMYFLSINPLDIKYLISGIFILVPPFSKQHIKGIWNYDVK